MPRETSGRRRHVTGDHSRRRKNEVHLSQEHTRSLTLFSARAGQCPGPASTYVLLHARAHTLPLGPHATLEGRGAPSPTASRYQIWDSKPRTPLLDSTLQQNVCVESVRRTGSRKQEGDARQKEINKPTNKTGPCMVP